MPSAISEQFKINLNQKLWGLLLGLAALGTAEHFGLCTLFWFALTLAVIMLISVVFTTIAYTVNYWRNRFKLGHSPECSDSALSR